MIVLGLAGQAGAGKDSVADYLVRRYGFIKFSFGDALYREVAQAFGLEDESLLRDRATKEVRTSKLALEYCSDAAFSELVIAKLDAEQRASGGDLFLVPQLLNWSPREILQWWGTEYRRAQDPDYWVKRAAEFVFGLRSIFEYPEQAPQLFVNTSVRFENERAWVRKMGGNVWHIHRDNLNAVAEHVSETPLPVLPPERELWNNYTLEYLHKGVEQLLNTDAKFVRMEPPVPVEQHSIDLDVTVSE